MDGYNIIFAWDDLNELAKYNIESARGKLMDILSNYQGYKKMTLILVFDAYKVKGNQGEVGMYHNIHVVYTKEAETADQYIEKTVHRIGHNGNVTVASSDGLEQIIIMGAGAHRLSARDLRTEIEHTNGQIRENYLEKEQKTKSYLLENASGELGDFLKELEEERRSADPMYARSVPKGTASGEMCTFLIINISSLQLLPVNMIAYRSQYGSRMPMAIVGPALVITLATTLVAVVFCLAKQRQ